MANRQDDLKQSINSNKLLGFIAEANEISLSNRISDLEKRELSDPYQLTQLAFAHETLGIKYFSESIAKQDRELLKSSRDHFANAFRGWKALLEKMFSLTSDYKSIYTDFFQLSKEPTFKYEVTRFFRLAVSGLLAQVTAETRLELDKFDLVTSPPDNSWEGRVANSILISFILLTRKANGWKDIEQAVQLIDQLRKAQAEMENSFLKGFETKESQIFSAVRLVGLYHLAQMITLTGDYLLGDDSSVTQINTKLDRHRDNAAQAFITATEPESVQIVDLLWVGCRELAKNSIWTHVKTLGKNIQEFAKLISSKERLNPVIELWPSQQRALQSNLLDTYPSAIIVEMPTSSGKTLLAKFSIIQARSLNPEGTIAYVVPTRALVNQITFELRSDFSQLGWSVEQTIPAYEMDPTEDKFLSSSPNILVTTPEKLDLLIKRDHTSVSKLIMVIADEAHSIADPNRGARLELLLATIKRDKPVVRFLLLSPFLRNAQELVNWLGEDRALPPIRVSWKPGNKIVGTVSLQGRSANRALTLRTIPSIENSDIKTEIEIPIAKGEAIRGKRNTIESLSDAISKALSARGVTLILCRGKVTAINRAYEIASELPPKVESTELSAVIKYANAEMGFASKLSFCLKRGIAFHHAGMSQEMRWLIEGLIKRGEVKIVCGTTTLAQGVNFPISNVIIETVEPGNSSLSVNDFWNIAGRAGRTLVDSLGVIAFPSPNNEAYQEIRQFLRQEASEVTSQLLDMLQSIDSIGEKFTTSTVERWPEFGYLMQFLAHAVRVSGASDLASQVEDLLRSSLVYHQARKLGRQSTRDLLAICRSYIKSVSSDRGLISLADQTGFSTPSVKTLLASTANIDELNHPENWLPNRLFGDDIQPLTERVEVVAQIPEIKLGQGTDQPFNPELVASILRDWVNGKNLVELANSHWKAEEIDIDRKLTNFCNYLFSNLLGKASWGIGSLESITLAGSISSSTNEEAYIPSMIFFGVQDKESVWLRMAGVPRIIAKDLGKLWKSQKEFSPESYDEIRGWMSALPDSSLSESISPEYDLSPAEIRTIWKALSVV